MIEDSPIQSKGLLNAIGDFIGNRERFLILSAIVFIIFTVVLALMNFSYVMKEVRCIDDGGVSSQKYGCVFPVNFSDPDTETQCSLARLKCNQDNFLGQF